MSQPVYRFGDVQVDVARFEVLREGARVDLEPKAVEVLLHLIEHRDRLVSKDELLDTIWRGTFVTPNALTRVVAQLRRALGDDAREARYIETVTRKGYRFLAPVAIAAAAQLDPIMESRTSEGVAGVAGRQARPAAGTDTRALAWRPRLRPAGVRLSWSLLALATLLVVGAGWLWLTARAERDVVSAPAIGMPVQVTSWDGFDGTPAVSPDGTMVAFSSDRTGALEIFVTPLAPGSREVQVTANEGQNVEPAFSPDGRHLAFHSRRRGGIWIVPVTGGGARQIAEFGSSPDWAPGGDLIVFASDAGGMAAQATLWLVRPDGTGLRPLTRLGAPLGGHQKPAFSRDGRHVSFLVTEGAKGNALWFVSTADGRLTRIVDQPWAAKPSFGPTDEWLFWTGRTSDGHTRIWRQRLDASRRIAIGARSEVLPVDTGLIDGLSISRTGVLVYSVVRASSNLWSLPLGADGMPAGQPARVTSTTGRSTFPTFSPDGDRVAFVVSRIGAHADVWIVGTDGRDPEVLLADRALQFNPSWSPDGRSVWLAWSEGPRKQFARVNRETRRVAAAFDLEETAGFPRLSPDGRTVAYHRLEASGRMGVWTRPVAGGVPRRISCADRSVGFPAWSPDGRWLAVEVLDGDQTHAAIVPSDGGPIEVLTRERGQYWPHSWAPDSDRIAIAAEREGVWNLWSLSRTTRELRSLTGYTSASGFVRYPAWSPHGDRIVFERAERAGNVWMLDVTP